MRLLAGILAGQDGHGSSSPATSRSRAGRWSASPSRSRRMGARVETTDGHAPLVDRGRAASRDRLRAARRERAGQVGRPARGALRGRARRPSSSRSPTRDHTERMLERAGARRHAPAERASRSSLRERLAAREIEVPGDFSSAAPFLVAADARSGLRAVTSTASNLNPRRTGLLDVLERMGASDHDLQPAPDRRRAGRRPRGARLRARRRRRSRPPRCRGLIDELPLLRARGVPCARGESRRPRRGGAAREGVRPDRGRRRGAASARRPHPRDATTASGSGASRRACGAASSTPAATIASRCSARSPGSSRARASSSRTPRRWRKLPRLLRAARAGRAGRGSLPSRDMIVAIDGPAGAGKSTVARALARAARLPLPRHRRDVPRAHLARAARRRRRSTDGPRSRRSRARIRSRSATAAASDRRGGRDDGDPRAARSTASCPSSRATPRCAR